ncbi:c-type cytochrome biogenesis protein CcsB [Marmoricola endophyticus]|uniref:C-type cytochrome biogenesis protein CcsB n=1 Tax=Marmoricola endophyticus TaxID=2040280 RepID=A0A917BKA9_9ACTN|nr:c-type cytochrome biogenesis protein CcsB [Marmoricola endophyticus]GGF45212.1 c-type cytochrome biogenesis protein CcsB [Marmoricola endophyticus]
MSHDQFEVLSNQAVAACAFVYFLVFLSHLAAWVTRPREVAAATPAAVSTGTAGGVAVADPPAQDTVGGGSDRADLWKRIAVSLTVVAAVIHLLALVTRGLAADPVRVPWSNMYEFTLTATWVVVALFLVTYKRFKLAWLAPVLSVFVLVVLMVDVLFLYEPVVPLRDALQSPWLVIHVLAAITATGAFTMGGICSALYLVKDRSQTKHGTARGWLASIPSLDALDRLAYRWHAFSFPVWTFAALIAGPIWAEYAWGRYWGWDPKEVWAFITWVVYAGYLHARATAGWKGRRAAIVALVGLATLWFNFVGINFFFGAGSQHSYAAELIVRSVGG